MKVNKNRKVIKLGCADLYHAMVIVILNTHFTPTTTSQSQAKLKVPFFTI